MASVFDTARYILETEGPMSTMKLQKLCYYAQAWSLVWDDNELFPEEFHAWVNGPVCSELYHATAGRFKVSAEDERGNSQNLSDVQKDSINKVLEFYAQHDAQWLSRLTHLEAPWKLARGDAPIDAHISPIISKESMAEYYGGL